MKRSALLALFALVVIVIALRFVLWFAARQINRAAAATASASGT